VFSSDNLPFAIVHINLLGKEIVRETETEVLLRVSAGENWDKLVGYTTTQGWSGLELLSAIPGTVGAAPMQNIGAYGAEFADCAESVEVYNRDTERFEVLVARDCRFGYRTSVFKTIFRGKFVIVSATLRLSKLAPELPKNGEVAQALGSGPISPQAIRAIVQNIRARKLEDPYEVANVGSFFENPIITPAQKEALLKEYPTAPIFSLVGTENVKVSAGWLLEQAGYKGKTLGHFQFSPKHALVLTHRGGGTMTELQGVIAGVQKDIKERFGIDLRVEPELVVY
jgi:UDP-N-acetylmuramate dehydrogenase